MKGENLYSCSPSAPKPQSADKKPLICPSCLILRHPHVRSVCSEGSWQVIQKFPPWGTYKSLPCVFNPFLAQALVKIILYSETCSYSIWSVEVVETHMPVLSEAFSTVPHSYQHLYVLYLFIFLLSLHWKLFDYFRLFLLRLSAKVLPLLTFWSISQHHQGKMFFHKSQGKGAPESI